MKSRVIIFALFLAALGLALAPAAAAGQNVIPDDLLKVLRQDTNILMRLRVAELLGCPALQNLDVPGALANTPVELPVDPAQIAEILVGGTEREDPVVIIAFTQAQAAQNLIQQVGLTPRQQPIGGRTVLQGGGSYALMYTPEIMLVFDSRRQTEEALLRLTAGAPANGLVQQFCRVNATAALMVGDQELELEPMDEDAHLERCLVTLQAGPTLVLEGEAELANPAQGDMLGAMVFGVRGMARQGLAEVLGEQAPAVPALDTMQVRVQGATVTARMEIGAADVAVLEQLLQGLPRWGMRSRLTAHEASAIATLRTINVAEQQFKTGEVGSRYGSLADLSKIGNPAYLDTVVGSGTKSGYTFVMTIGPAAQSYSVRAAPIDPGVTGNRYFYTNSGAVIFAADDPTVDHNSNPID